MSRFRLVRAGSACRGRLLACISCLAWLSSSFEVSYRNDFVGRGCCHGEGDVKDCLLLMTPLLLIDSWLRLTDTVTPQRRCEARYVFGLGLLFSSFLLGLPGSDFFMCFPVMLSCFALPPLGGGDYWINSILYTIA